MTITIQLSKQYKQLLVAQPSLSIRDAANQLGVCELVLLELELGTNVIRLKKDFKLLLKELEGLGKVQVLINDEHVMHKGEGIYKNILCRGKGNTGVVIILGIKLEFSIERWQYGYAVRTKNRENEICYALQFFNHQGAAVHKIYLTKSSNPLKFNKILQKYQNKKYKNKRLSCQKLKQNQLTNLKKSNL